MIFPGPRPDVGAPGNVTLAGIPLMLVPGTYKVEEPPRFGGKISVGSLKYTDFNPFESAQAVAYLTGGYGLRRYSDLDTTTNQYNQMSAAQRATSMYAEAHNVDARFGPIILGAEARAETLPGSTTPPLWAGEVTPAGGSRTWVVVTQRRVYVRSSGGTWTDTGIALPADAVRGAIGVFNGKLTIGFGAAATAVYTTDLATTVAVTNDATTPVPLHVFAYTSDRAAAYIGGGALPTDVHKVYASADGGKYEIASETVCDSADFEITALSPGGGLGLVFVGKETDLGTIDNDGIFRKLVPLDSVLLDNCRGMRWWLGAGVEEQRGPLILVFPRDRSLWAYEPSSQTAGTAQNISPWSEPQIRPPTVRGKVTAIQGTARWLYYAITNDAGESWIAARDARTGANHASLLDLGVGADTQMLGITSLFGSPMLFAGQGNHLVATVLPRDGEVPFDNVEAGCRFCPSGIIDLPDMDLGFPDEDKVILLLRIVADDLIPGAQRIRVYASFDGSPYGPVGIAEHSPFTEITFLIPPVAKRIGLRLKLETTTDTLTPKLLGVSVRMSLNTRLYRQWSFQGILPAGSSPLLTDMLDNPKETIGALWSARETGTPIVFIDRWQDIWNVRLLQMGEVERYNEIDRVPESLVEVALLQVIAGTDDSLTFFAPVGGTLFFPFAFPWSPFYASTMYAAQTVALPAGSGTIYPRWQLTGPGYFPVLTGPHGEVWSLDYTLSSQEVVSIDFDPSRKTVISNAAGDLFERVVAGSQWWPLQAGDNAVTVLMGATTAASQAKIIWRTPTTY